MSTTGSGDLRRSVGSGSPYEATIGFSRAVRTGDRIIVSGTAPVWPNGTCDLDPAAQTRRCFEIIFDALERLGAGPADVVRTRMFVTDAQDAQAVGTVHGEFFGAIRPANTIMQVTRFIDPEWLVEVEADALIAAPARPGDASAASS